MTLRGPLAVMMLGTTAVVAAPLGANAQIATYPAGVQRIVESAKARGLPPGSILTKAAEGAQLHASAERIVGVAQVEANRLDIARTLLGVGAPDADLQAGAVALSYQIPNAALSAIRKARPTGSVAVPLGLLTQLVTSGDAVPAATQAVVNVMRRGVTDPQLVVLGKQIGSDVARDGMTIESAAELRFEGLTAALPTPGSRSVTTADPTTLAGQSAGTLTTIKPPAIKPPIVKKPPQP